jgi:hypothetical protein
MGNAERTGPVKYDKPIEMPRRVPDIVGDPHPSGRVDTGWTDQRVVWRFSCEVEVEIQREF